MRLTLFLGLLSVGSAAAQVLGQPVREFPRGAESESVSLTGKNLFSYPDEQGLAAKADAALAADPANLDLLLAAGQAHASLLRFNRAIGLFSRALAQQPDDPRALRYRGHRYLSLRQFPAAIADLERARNKAQDSFEVAYYLGLGYYLNGDFARAAGEHGRCLALAKSRKPTAAPSGLRPCQSISDEARAALLTWRYLALRRSGQDAEAAALLKAIPTLETPELEPYHRILRVFRQQQKPEDVLGQKSPHPTLGYPIGLIAVLDGNPERGCGLLRAALDFEDWSALGSIAAEVDLARRGVCR